MRLSSRVTRAGAWTLVLAGVAAPLVRRRRHTPVPVITAATVAAPIALCVVLPRTRARDVGVCLLQMWAYVAHYEMPNDDPERLRERVHVDYPVNIDRVIGLGQLPGARLQHLLGRTGRVNKAEQVLVWSHWLWFFIPHGTVAYHLAFHREHFERSALLTYAVFDLGLIGYWAVPTAPPWYAANVAEPPRIPELRRMMVEHGEKFWKTRWPGLYGSLAGNPLAAMPSLHFATSVMAAHLLAERGRGHAVLGWTYAGTLGFALVYLGEHYVVDLLVGLALTESVRKGSGRVAPAARLAGRAIQRLERVARP